MTGLAPGALTALLAEVAAAPEKQEAEAAVLPAGTLIGRFEIVRELGRGGFGVVYEARDRDLGRQVALKVVRPGRVAAEEGKVTREAEAIARLAHPNLVTLHDVGQSDHGPYLVFELLRGKTLDLRLEEGPMPVQEAVHVAAEVARGLAHAHAEGVVHRDLKPSNVFITNKGQVKILDFGMAHAFGRRRLSGGTPAYMAPEQWEDEPEDERTDVFALGVMLYRMLTGEYPFPEGKGRWSSEGGRAPKLDVPGAPELGELVERMLDRATKARPRDGAAVLVELTPIEEKLRARPVDGKPPEHAKRRKATFGDLLAELKRRHVFRVMVGYGVFAFAVLQVTEPVLHAYDLPAWALTAVVTALAVGFPIAVVLAWAYDLTAQGVKRTPAASGAPVSRRARFLMPLSVAAAVLALAAAGGGAWFAWTRSAASPSVAVLPFADLSPEHDQEYLADGLAEEILSGLAQLEGLKVLGRTTTFSFKGKGKTPGEIGRALGVEAVLDGSVRSAGDRLRISTYLVRVRDGATTWSKTFDRPMSDLFAVQEEIGRAVAEGLQVRLASAHAVARAGGTTNPEALRLFLLARDRARSMTVPDNAAAFEALQKAVSLDPRFAQAWAGIAMSLIVAESLGETGSSAHGKEQILQASERAVDLAPDLPDGYVARGNLRSFRFDWAGAEADLQRARVLAPGDGDVAAVICMLAVARGKFERAAAECERAIAVDPLNPWYRVNAMFAWTSWGDLDRAVAAGRRALDITPDGVLPPWLLGIIAVVRGRPDEALREAAKVGPSAEWVRIGIRALAFHDLGQEAESRIALDEFARRFAAESAYQVAEIHAWRGEADAAFTWLERARDQEDVGLVWIQGDPLLRKIRGDPRYAALLRSMNLHPSGSEREGGAAVPGRSGAQSRAAAPSIAVLPFADMSPKHDQEYFADGVAEEIRSALARVPGLRVPGRTSSSFFKGKNARLEEVGRELEVEHVLEGSVRRSGRKVRIVAEVVRAPSGDRVWSETFEREVTDIFAIQDEIARAAVKALRSKLLDGRSTIAKVARSDNQEAYESYLLGKSLMRTLAVDSMKRALAALEKAVRLDPVFAPAWAALAGARLRAGSLEVIPWSEARREAIAAANRAVALAPDLPDALATRGMARLLEWDWAGAKADLDRALQLDPDNQAAIRAMEQYSNYAGKAEEALHWSRRTVAVDPLDVFAWANLSSALAISGRYEEEDRATRRALELSPGSVWILANHAWALLYAGRAAEALEVCTKFEPDDLDRAWCEADAYQVLGDEGRSRKALDRLLAQGHGEQTYMIADAYAARGDTAKAFEWLDKAYAGRVRMLNTLRVDPGFRGLHGDPRWAALLRKMNLPAD